MYEFKKEFVYLMIYKFGWCLDFNIVVLIVKIRVGESEYDFVFNNCEYFVMSCKIGVFLFY